MSGRKHSKGEATRDAILAFVIQYKQANDGASSSLREICEACSIASTSTAHYHLQALNDSGRIQIDFSTARNIRVPGGEWVYREQP